MSAVMRWIPKYDLKPDYRFQNENREQQQQQRQPKIKIESKKNSEIFIFNHVDKFLLMVFNGWTTMQTLLVTLIKGRSLFCDAAVVDVIVAIFVTNK